MLTNLPQVAIHTMISRRRFLGFLASLAAVFGKASVAAASSNKTASQAAEPALYLHKGWILRSDDLSSSQNPDRES